MLDVACGAGQIAIPAARAGAQVTGIDIASNLVEQARSRAAAEGVQVQFDEGDAEALPYPDAAFDLVVSLIGAMFAPRPELVAAELVRACKPGGRIVMANWTPEGHVGQMFKIVGTHVPPPPLMPSPLKWGDEATVRDRLRDGTASIECTRRMYPMRYPFPPAEVAEFFFTYYGPTFCAMAALDAFRQAALRQDLVQLWSNNNKAQDGTTHVEAEYLEVVAVRS
jgi:SAM-dependent methyltransferase